MSHRIPLGGTGWSVWRDVVLRSTGFPVTGLDRFAAPAVATAADALLAGEGDVEIFDKAFDAALLDGSVAATQTAADPLLREAVTWQNPGVLHTLDGLLGTDPAARNSRRRKRETGLLRYWQRYCGKAETIGFFGPVNWATIDPDRVGTEVRPGPGLVADRRVHFEAWALMAYAERLGADPDVRHWWAPVLPPHLAVQGRLLHRPPHPPVPLTAAEAALLTRCDGRTPAHLVAEAVCADPAAGLRSAADAALILDRLVERSLLSWDAALPNSPDAESALLARIAAIGDPELRQRIDAEFATLRAGRDAVAAAAGDPDRLGTAIEALNHAFATASGQAATRHSGQMYAGRTIVYEETSRDVALVVGSAVLDALAEPLAVVLRAARWLTAEFGAAGERVLTELYDELSVDGPVSLSELWSLAQGMLWAADGPTATVAADFTARWAELFGLDAVEPGQAELRLTSAELAGRVATVFAAERPGWPSARIHSPDIQLCAPSAAALARGDFLLVLGELHPGYVPFDSAVFVPFHPDPAALRAALDADLGPARIRVLYPAGFPRQTTRTTHGLNSPLDCQLGIDTVRGAEIDRLVPAAGVRVEPVDGQLRAVLPDGRSWPLIEVFGNLLGSALLDSFKLVAPATQTPRITIDRLVVARRTWRCTVAETGLTGLTDERARYLAVRRWRARLGLPDRVFVKISTEVKPCYVDLGGPLHVRSFCAMLDAAARVADQVAVVVGEVLPDAGDAWLPDAAGRGYVSELRLQITDSATYPSSGAPR